MTGHGSTYIFFIFTDFLLTFPWNEKNYWHIVKNTDFLLTLIFFQNYWLFTDAWEPCIKIGKNYYNILYEYEAILDFD